MKKFFFSKTEKRFWGYLISWLLIFALGTVVYWHMYSHYPSRGNVNEYTQNHTAGELAIRSTTSSLDLFFFNIDSNCVDGWLRDSKAGRGWGWGLFTAASLAGIWTISLAITLIWTLFYKRIKTRRFLHDKNTDLYIFVGINNRSKLLAADILANQTSKTVCLFLVPPDTGQETETSLWNRVFKTVHYKQTLYQDLGNLNAQVLIAEKRIIDCVDMPDQDVWQAMGLPIVKGYIKHSHRTHILLLSDNEADNVLGARRLNDDSTLNQAIHPSTIICMARRNSINRILEDMGTDVVGRKIELKVIDSSFMAIEALKSKVNYHPIQFVHLDSKNPTTVDSAFDAMIIGFSECGQDALRFLYEFGAFVDSSDSNGDKRSPFRCDIVDAKLDKAAARWIHDAPRLFEGAKEGTSQHGIYLHQMDAHSEAFYAMLDDRMPNLNCIVITVGNDMMGISMAVDILKYALRIGKSFAQFRIFVRAYDATNYEYMTDIANHYNAEEERLVIFGQEEALFTKKMIIDDEFAELGKIYQSQYEQCRIENKIDVYPAETWIERREKVFSDRQNPSFLKELQNLRRVEGQDRANALHALTKLTIYDQIDQPDDVSIREKMGQLEHLRWLAAHELMGYQDAKEKNILQYQHDCMKPWSKLSDATRAYDCIVWDTTLRLKEQYAQKGYLSLVESK